MSKTENTHEMNGGKIKAEELLGVRLIEASNGSSICHWFVEDKFKNGNNVALGGFITSVADIGMAYAVLSVIEENISFTSISINTSFHRPATVDSEVIITSKIKRQGRTTAYLESELYQNDQLIADVTSTILFLKHA